MQPLEPNNTTLASSQCMLAQSEQPRHVEHVVTCADGEFQFQFPTLHLSCTGGSVGSVEGDPKRDTTPKVDAIPAAAEQQAVDDSYKSGDSPYEFSRVRPAYRSRVGD